MLDILRVLVKRHNLNDVGIPPISQFTQKKNTFFTTSICHHPMVRAGELSD
jgi:hypothetical protein